jgi:hypothetical protein
MSLNNLGAFLSALGWHDDALIPAREAVDIRRKLAQSNPQHSFQTWPGALTT